MGDNAGVLSMKAQFIPLGITFSSVAENASATLGFIGFEKGEIFWNKIRKKVTSKDWNNSEIKLP